jgi:hypothetical protein
MELNGTPAAQPAVTTARDLPTKTHGESGNKGSGPTPASVIKSIELLVGATFNVEVEADGGACKTIESS